VSPAAAGALPRALRRRRPLVDRFEDSGMGNIASGDAASVSGGKGTIQANEFGWAAATCIWP